MVCAVPRTGRLGFVMENTAPTPVRYTRIRNWSLNSTVTPEMRVYSGTRFGVQRLKGFIEHSGTFQGYGAVPPLFVGDEFTFLGYTAPTSGVPCSAGCAYGAKSIVSELTINWSWTAEDKKVFWTVNFFTLEPLVFYPTFADPCDDIVYCDDDLCEECPEFLDCLDVPLEFCNITTAALTFNGNLVEYSNCSTLCTKKRIPGNLDWSLDIVDQNPCIVPTLDMDYAIKLPATKTPATFWALNWGKLTGVSNFNVDVENNTLIGKTNRFEMQAVNCCVPATPVLGSIIKPDLTQVWPFVPPVIP